MCGTTTNSSTTTNTTTNGDVWEQRGDLLPFEESQESEEKGDNLED